MSHAPTTTYFPPHGDGTIRGCFTHKEFGTYFEFSAATTAESAWTEPQYNMKVWVGGHHWRLAQVLKTVVHVIVDEDQYGRPILERWPIKQFQLYPRPGA